MERGASLRSLTSHSPEETKTIAGKLGSFLEKGDILSLTGDLGAGKTCFVQGLARALDLDLNITSPTFTLIKEYSGHLPLYHFDAYRLSSPQELIELGYEEYFFNSGVTVVEWGDRVASLFPQDFLEIEFHRLDGNNRRLLIKPHNNKWKVKVERWIKLCSS